MLSDDTCPPHLQATGISAVPAFAHDSFPGRGHSQHERHPNAVLAAIGGHLLSLSFSIHKSNVLHRLLSPHLQAIKNHKNAHQQYVDRLLKEGQISKEQIDKIHEDIHSLLQKNFETAKVRLSTGKDAPVGWWLLEGGHIGCV